MRKSDFPTKRSHFRKKVFLFVSIRKNFFLANFFGESNFGHTFHVHFRESQNSFGKVDFFDFWKKVGLQESKKFWNSEL